MNRGYIRLWRKIEDFDWYKNPVVLSLWIHILLNANHKDKSYQGITIKRGTFKTGLKMLSYETGLSIQQIRTSLNKLELTNNITSKITNKYRIITVLNYNDYQNDNKQPNKQITNKTTIKQQSNNNQITTTNTLKHLKNVKKEPKIKYLDFVKLTETEYKKLVDKFGEQDTKNKIQKLDDYIGSKGTKYVSHYRTILNWSKKDTKDKVTGYGVDAL